MFRPAMLRALACAALTLTYLPYLYARPLPDPAAFDQSIAPFLKEHCFACHGPDKQKSGIRFDTLAGYRSENSSLWTKVHEALAFGEMPPEDEKQPDPAETTKLLAWIQAEQRTARTGLTRRLNRREFSASLQDLTGLRVDFAGGLPEDGKVGGFDTGADGLQDAADSVEQLMDVARRAVDGIRFLDPPPATPATFDLLDPQFKDVRKAIDQFKEQGISSKGKNSFWREGIGLLLTPRWLGERDSFDIAVTPPADGKGIIRLTVEVSSKLPPFPDVPSPHLAVTIGGKEFEVREITNPGNSPLRLEFEAQFEDLAAEPDGIVVSLKNLVEIPYSVKGWPNEDRTKPEDKIPGGGGTFRPLIDKQKLPDPLDHPVPYLVLHKLEIDPDFVAPWPPHDGSADPDEISDSPESARHLLGLWIDRASRRPATDSETKPFFDFYADLRRKGLPFDAALRAAFQSVLLGGPFRYLASPADPDPVAAQFAIATRLSFMLSGAPPDGELRRLATAGKLRDPAILDAQVDRLLAGPRSGAFFHPFVTQWLEMGQPITLVMDHLNKVDHRFGRFLKESMRAETISYIAKLIEDNRPARELVDSGWTMMNNSLALHYGYDGIIGGHLQKVDLRKDDPRGGGILGHAGIQSMLCWMGDNWVIYRGAWTLRHILDDPPPPPPLEVPELDPSAGNNRGKSPKELLLQHQEEENCAVCHRTMDPLGFAFQNFDISGRWRHAEFEKYLRNELDGKIEWRGEGKSRDVDASGTLPRGEAFSSFAEAKNLIAEHYLEDVLRGLLKNLVIYGTGRQADIDDLAEIREIIHSHKSKNFPLRDVLKAFVRSKAFLGP